MAINQAYPSLNAIEPSWADVAITFTIGGGQLITMADIAAIKWGRKVEVGKKRGASGGRVMARTTGQGDQDCSVTLYRAGHRQLVKGLVAKAPTRGNQAIISLVSFDIMIQYTPPGEPEIYEYKIKGCRYLVDGDDTKEGTDPSKIELTLDPIEIAQIINGVEVVLL